MLKNILKIAFRSFYGDKSFSVINLLGLAIGIVVFVFIMHYAAFEMSYDNFHVHGPDIYRVSRYEYGENLEIAHAKAFYAIGPAAFESFPEEALERELDDGWYKRKIIGVISDYHQRSPQFKIEPLIISPFSKEQGYISLTVLAQNLPQTLDYVEEVYKTMFPANAFDYFFLDEYFERQFESDKQFGKVITLFSGLAIFIAGLGLAGLASFLSQSRMKEVGTRKVLGATIYDILFLFNKGIIKLIGLSCIISFPLIYWISQKWLENYATRIHVNSIYFILPCLVMLVISITIITAQIWKLGRTNPVELLRYE